MSLEAISRDRDLPRVGAGPRHRMSQGPRGQSRHSSLRKADRDEIAISRGSWRGSRERLLIVSAQGTAPCGDGKPSGRVCLRARVRERRSCCGGRGCTRLQYGESAAAGRARPHALHAQSRFATSCPDKLACGLESELYCCMYRSGPRRVNLGSSSSSSSSTVATVRYACVVE